MLRVLDDVTTLSLLPAIGIGGADARDFAEPQYRLNVRCPPGARRVAFVANAVFPRINGVRRGEAIPAGWDQLTAI